MRQQAMTKHHPQALSALQSAVHDVRPGPMAADAILDNLAELGWIVTPGPDLQAAIEVARREPARIVGLVMAVLGVASAFGLGLSDDQTAAVVALVGAVLAVLGAEAVRARVTPVARPGAAAVRPRPGPLTGEQDDQDHAPAAEQGDPVQ